MSEVIQRDTMLSYITGSVESSAESVAIRAINERGREDLEKTPFPTRKDEDWRFVDLKSITKSQFCKLEEANAADVGDISEHYLPEAMNCRLVFVNGVYNEELSSVEDLPNNVIVGNLAANADNNSVKEHLGTITNYDDDVFAPFNDAAFTDGAFIFVPEETVVRTPIHILNVFTDAEKAFYATPRLLYVGEMFSKSTIIEEHIGLADNQYLNVPVTEFKMFTGSNVHHARIQRDSKKASHVSRPIAILDKNAEYHSYTICLGAKLFRNDPRVIQNAEEVNFTVDGLVLIDGDQIADTHSIMDHRFEHAGSHQLHKVVVNDSAHSVFNGKIFVAKDAQKIDSFQENRNLLLSENGKVNTKPQLEIFADDVKCSHGCTIGQLDDQALFYMQQRGIPKKEAKALLMYAFANTVLESVKIPELKSRINKLIAKKLNVDLGFDL